MNVYTRGHTYGMYGTPRVPHRVWPLGQNPAGAIIHWIKIYPVDSDIHEDFKLEKGPTEKAKELDPGGSDQQNLGFNPTVRSVFLFFSVIQPLNYWGLVC